ncbi:sensor histidine kinase [Vibrio penaeicida]|uniref:sensor histidine kinase n=1 Tax=Vibrio penaeicida TaxID=104609 RepID=UPI000CEA1E29|nr:ATP-binding protein [Vibrio penaeicida]
MNEKSGPKNEELEYYKRAYSREKKIRKEAEKLLETKSRELYESLGKLQETLLSVQNLRDQMIHSEKMAAIGQLAAGITHEINNPVSYAMSNLNQLRSYIQDLIDLDQVALQNKDSAIGLQAYLAHRQSAEITLTIVDIKELLSETIQGLNRIKEISLTFKKASHKGTSEYAEVNIQDCLENSLNVVHSELKHSIAVNKNIQNIPSVKGSYSQLQQVFINLFVNAKHATPDKGVFTITTEPIDMGDKDWVKISIKDTGKGIKAEDLAHIFEPFFTTKEVGKGTGLGLSISYEIIKNHKGSIEVASEVGIGTTFTILLPGM